MRVSAVLTCNNSWKRSESSSRIAYVTYLSQQEGNDTLPSLVADKPVGLSPGQAIMTTLNQGLSQRTGLSRKCAQYPHRGRTSVVGTEQSVVLLYLMCICMYSFEVHAACAPCLSRRLPSGWQHAITRRANSIMPCQG